MHAIILFVHIFIAFVIIVLVLVQQGRGADTGASFGSGASQTVFGSQGSGNFLTRTTSVLAAIFFATSFTLAVLTKKELGNATPNLSAPVQEQPSSVSAPPAGKTNDQDVPAGVVPVPGGSNNDASKTAPKPDTQGAPAGVVPVPGANKPKTDADVPVKQ